MNLLNVAATMACIALMSVEVTPGAKAEEWNKKTVVTFSGPVEIPGVHLTGWKIQPDGTYVFKFLDSQSDRHIARIFSQDEKTIIATILTIPNYRLKATSKTVMTFRERPAGEPEALRAWFYPGTNWGDEFVYPKARAVDLSKTGKTPVLFTAAQIPVEVAEPITTVDAPVVVQLKQAPVMAIQPGGEESAVGRGSDRSPGSNSNSGENFAGHSEFFALDRAAWPAGPLRHIRLRFGRKAGFIKIAGSSARRVVPNF
jgi:hypothetical protein